MKQSEMQKYIELILENQLGTSWNGYGEVASYLLTKLEEKGMAPPAIKVERTTRVQHPTTKEWGDFKQWTMKHEWEPEDETT